MRESPSSDKTVQYATRRKLCAVALERQAPITCELGELVQLPRRNLMTVVRSETPVIPKIPRGTAGVLEMKLQAPLGTVCTVIEVVCQELALEPKSVVSLTHQNQTILALPAQ